jgi:hypothetical protein
MIPWAKAIAIALASSEFPVTWKQIRWKAECNSFILWEGTQPHGKIEGKPEKKAWLERNPVFIRLISVVRY